MKSRRFIAGLAVAASAATMIGVAVSGNANASAPSPTLTSAELLQTETAGSYNLGATGLIPITPGNSASCTTPGVVNHSASSLLLPPIASISDTANGCFVSTHNQTATAASSFAAVSLLGGAISITGIDSVCGSDADGNVTVGSTVATLDGKPVPAGASSISIAGVATVYLDHNSETYGANNTAVLESVAVEVVVAPITATLFGQTVLLTAGEDIKLGECFIGGNLMNDDD